MPISTIPDLSSDFYFDIASGDHPNKSSVNKFGSNEAVAAGTEESIWDGGGTYSFPTTADITHLRQAIDQAAMRGGVVEIQGLDTNWALTVQNVTLNASNTTTPVALTTALKRVFRMKVLADVVTTEDIELRNVGGGTDYAIIVAGNNQTLMAIYTVPADTTAYMTSYYCDYVRDSVKDPDGLEFRLWVADRENGYEFQIKHKKGIPKQASGFQHEFEPPFKITEKSDIMITAEPSGANADVHAGFDLVLEDN